MNTFYTVDRRGLCSAGGKLNLTKPSVDFFWSPGQSIQETEEKLHSLFNEGLSPHGIQYLLGETQYVYNNNSVALIQLSPVIELTWELIRRQYFSTQPSRFQSYFGWEKLEEAKKFRNNSEHSIYKLECERFYKKDMNLLKMGTSNISAIDLAYKYWLGEISNTPQIEYLLVPEISVVEKISEIIL